MSKKATALFIILLVLLFLTGYSFSKAMREKKEAPQPVSQSYSQRSAADCCISTVFL